jgi:hypothetical protein
MFIRHGEKPPKNGDAPTGVRSDGSEDEHSLTVRGWTRAGALIGLFANAHDGVERPAKIFAANPDDPKGPHGRRPAQTVTPLAKALAIPLNTKHAVGQEAAAAAEILREPGPILVSWEHNNIPLIVAALGIAHLGRSWPDDRFDLVWIFRRTNGDFVFSEIGQRLLVDDRAP